MTPANAPRLIHIGLPKTATTSLQNIWRSDPGVTLVYQGLMKELHEIWSESYGKGNVLVLPVGLFLQDNGKFFQAIHVTTGIPVPNLSVKQNANPSMTREHLKLTRAFNEWCKFFSSYGIYQPQFPAKIQQALNIIRFAVRYNLDSPPPEVAGRVMDIESRLPDCKLDPSHISKELLGPIKSGFRELLGGDDFFGYRAQYADL